MTVSADKQDKRHSPLPASGKGSRGNGLVLAAILGLALALRLVGITWGLPDSLHYLSFHPDETVILTKSLPEFGGISFTAGHFLPHYYNYGSLPFYLINAAVSIGISYHLIGSIFSQGVPHPDSLARAYLAARLLSAAFGVGTCWAVYALGRCLWNPSVGLLAALILAVTPLHAQHSHYGTVDIGAAFWQTLSLVWSAKLIRGGLLSNAEGKDNEDNIHTYNLSDHQNTLAHKSKGKNLPDEQNALAERRRTAFLAAILAGLFAGLTAATKYSGALVIFCLFAALTGRVRTRNLSPLSALALFAAGIACAALAFVIACPGSILEPGLFLSGLQYESSHVMHQGEIYFQDTGPGWVYLIARNLDAGLGLPLLLLSLAGVIYAAVRRAPGDWLLVAFALPTYLVIGAAQSRYARYEIPLLPILALWAARLLMELPITVNLSFPLWEGGSRSETDGESSRRVVAGNALRRAFIGFASLVIIFTLADCAALLAPMTEADPRERAALWIQQHAPAPEKIGFSGLPWFWSPAINPYFAAPQPGAWRKAAAPAELARYCYNPDQWLDPVTLAQCRAPVVALTEYQYYDPLRLKQPAAEQFVAALRSQYEAPIIFASTHPLGGMQAIDGLPVQDLPHDMLYPSPTILIFSHR